MKLNWKLIIIITFAAFLSFYQLGNIPPSLDWDEVSLAYNAKALLQTGKDEHGNSWPITIRSFNDYKPSLYTYSLIPALAIFGESNFAIRFPSALFGTLTVLTTYFLVKELFPAVILSVSEGSIKRFFGFGPQNDGETVALLASFLLALSPWHLQFSRGAFEANLALFWFISGGVFLLKSRNKSQWLPIAALCYGLSLMAYHSTKVVIPLLVLTIGLPHLKTIWSAKRPLIISAAIATLFLIPIVRTIQLGVGQSRFSSVSFTTIDNLLDNSRHRIETENNSRLSRMINHRFLVYAKEVIGGYLDHYDIKFWFIEGDSIPRHTAVGLGLLHWWILPFVLIGILSMLNQPKNTKWPMFTWFLIAPAASALTSGTPNSIRAIFFTPTFEIFTALGIISFISWIKHRGNLFLYLLATCYLLLATVNVATYFHLYYTHTPKETSQAWQYGYQQMVEWVVSQKPNYKNVIITTAYDQPYIYVLWYGKYSPKNWVNNGEYGKGFDGFEFRPVKWDEDKQLTDTLLVGTPDEIKDKHKVIWSVNFLDGTPAFIAAPTN